MLMATGSCASEIAIIHPANVRLESTPDTSEIKKKTAELTRASTKEARAGSQGISPIGRLAWQPPLRPRKAVSHWRAGSSAL